MLKAEVNNNVCKETFPLYSCGKIALMHMRNYGHVVFTDLLSEFHFTGRCSGKAFNTLFSIVVKQPHILVTFTHLYINSGA